MKLEGVGLRREGGRWGGGGGSQKPREVNRSRGVQGFYVVFASPATSAHDNDGLLTTLETVGVVEE